MTISRNALWNLAGHAAPLLAALFLVPGLVGRLEAERFGFLSLAWVLVGYFSLFDLGLGRALSRLVAERSGTAREGELPPMSQSALALTLALGAVAGAVLFAAARPVCTRLLSLPAGLEAEAILALRVLAVCLPLVTLTAALRGLLEAGQRFGWVNAIRVPLGVLTFAAPFAVTLATTNLAALALSLALVRVAALAAHWVACVRLYPALVRVGVPGVTAAREMLGYGAWLTVSNVVGPLMVYLDRFVIGVSLAVSAVAYYAAPFEVITRLWVVPAALTGVLFPAFAGTETEKLLPRYRIGVKTILVTIFPLALFGALFAPEWLRAWLGAEYATQGARVAQLLCFGVLMNGLAYLPFTLLQARGRADLTAKAHMAELPLYVVLLSMLVQTHGIEGAALAWTLRCTADALVLFELARRQLAEKALVLPGAQGAVVALSLAALAGTVWPGALEARLAYAGLAALAFLPLAWFVLLEPEERVLAKDVFAWLRGAHTP